MFRSSEETGGNILHFLGKPDTVAHLRHVFGCDFRLHLADESGASARVGRIPFVFLGCDLKCSLADCVPNFLFTHRNRSIPFAVFRLLPVENELVSSPIFSLSFFEQRELSAAHARIISKLVSSEHYSRNLISQLPPGDKIAKILELQTEIVEKPSEHFGLAELARRVGFSSCWLSRKFKEISGTTLRNFLMKTTFCYSLWKLVATPETIKQIAFESGYKPLSFSARFKKHFGVSPSSLRERLAQNPT